jgi:hypothetical protein
MSMKHAGLSQSGLEHDPNEVPGHITPTDLESAQEKPSISDDVYHDQQLSESGEAAIDQERKDNIVDWDGPDDPHNPRNWPTWKRMIQVVLVSSFLLTA